MVQFDEGGKVPVPYITAWSEERVAVRSLAVRADGTGLAYRDEVAGDRDAHGVLWSRVGEAPGEGRPRFRVVHPVRQRRALQKALCQVCGGPAGRTGRGVLFLLPRPEGARAPGWPEGAYGMKPPVCVGCAAVAVRHCPRLGDPVAVRVRKARVRGVYGGFHAPGGGRLVAASEDGFLPYGHPHAAWFLASQLVVELRRCTVVDLAAEIGGAAGPGAEARGPAAA
ncbi:hypothetical protein [Streptomyces catenulae]|uniref:Uncharacterized protein n=1 Tax=Streptomyces catenulae TaxID=66875 RepID=A0ABV2Z6C2_9ACTN|nr:hypothetical protein [Streptomyces catenulae]